MIVYSNLRRIYEFAASSQRVLDIGGWWCPFHLATHVLDLMPYHTRKEENALDPEHPPRFTAETWVVHDACRAPWPFPDKFFDYSFCSHTLEDVRDPLAISAELIRVSRRGYIETPSREREIYCKTRSVALRAALGRMPSIGFDHHRWFVEIAGKHVRFTPKDLRLMERRQNFITRRDLGRKLTELESGAFLFWEGDFTFEEVMIQSPDELTSFRTQALRRLRSSKAT